MGAGLNDELSFQSVTSFVNQCFLLIIQATRAEDRTVQDDLADKDARVRETTNLFYKANPSDLSRAAVGILSPVAYNLYQRCVPSWLMCEVIML